MKSASVSDLKARLSHYLRVVRRGGEVQILDRGVPVAMLSGVVRAGSGKDEERLQRLIRAGIVRPGAGDASFALDWPPLAAGSDLRRALDEDRADRL